MKHDRKKTAIKSSLKGESERFEILFHEKLFNFKLFSLKGNALRFQFKFFVQFQELCRSSKSTNSCMVKLLVSLEYKRNNENFIIKTHHGNVVI